MARHLRATLFAAVLFCVLGCSRCPKDKLEIAGLSFKPTCLTPTYLASLPQTTATVSNDPDFPNQTLHISGVTLEALAHALNVPASLDLIDALCSDNYRAHYSAAYIAQHHPILVLTIDSLSPAAWATKTHQDDPGPYLIAYDHFAPSFQVLSHEDQPLLPTNVTRLTFSSAALAFAPITPPGTDPAADYPTGTPVQQSFTIAKQNCLRCHASGRIGGTKSGRSWNQLANIARARPEYFSSYILNPKSLDSRAQMPANVGYDDRTRAALTSYFQTFAR
jgi:mono/diheme cytochrome c family protein